MANPKDLIYKSERSMTAPRRFISVGGVFVWDGCEYVVKVRGEFDSPRDCCNGCAFKNGHCPDDVACSRYDRSDEVSVWFVKK